jgi:hypothetical protein
MGTFYPTIYLLNEDILIVFKEDGSLIEYIEIGKGNCIFNGINLFKTKYSELEKRISELDNSLEFSEGGFDSHKCGLGIYRRFRNGKYSIYPKNLIFFNKDYKSKKTPSTDEIINFYLGKARGK